MSDEDGWDTIDERDTVLTCSSGFVFENVNCGIIGLSKWDTTTVYAGYDDTFFAECHREYGLRIDSPSNQDLVELAAFMIKQWTEFKRHYEGLKENDDER